MINPLWLELPMSRTNFHGPEDVRAIAVQLYLKSACTPQPLYKTFAGNQNKDRVS